MSKSRQKSRLYFPPLCQKRSWRRPGRSKSSFKQLFSSSKIFLAPGEKRPPRPELQMSLIIQSKAAQQCFQEAADMFSLAVQYDPAAGRHYESRSKAFRKLLDLEGARRDFICTLILDPTNEELPPMLMSLFPGCSAADVLSSPAGQAVRARLMDSIQACSSSSDQQRLSEDLLKMTLTNEHTASRPEGPSVGEELKEMQITGKSLLRLLKGESKLVTAGGLQTDQVTFKKSISI